MKSLKERKLESLNFIFTHSLEFNNEREIEKFISDIESKYFVPKYIISNIIEDLKNQNIIKIN
jgi:hypothetical protein